MTDGHELRCRCGKLLLKMELTREAERVGGIGKIETRCPRCKSAVTARLERSITGMPAK